MPVSLANSQVIYGALKACDVKIISALPETWLVHLIRMADDDPEVTLVRVAKEEEAIGISAGAHLAGVNSALLMQNHGFLASNQPDRLAGTALQDSTADAHQLPRPHGRARSLADAGRHGDRAAVADAGHSRLAPLEPVMTLNAASRMRRRWHTRRSRRSPCC